MKIAISIGDLNGIGPEVVLKTFSNPLVLAHCTPIIYASQKSTFWWRKHLNLNVNINLVTEPQQAVAHQLNVINVWTEDLSIDPGKQLPVVGKYAVKSLVKAADDVAAGLADLLVTAPINKSNVYSAEFPHSGHTTYLAERFGKNKESVMMMVSDSLRVGIVTVHIPIAEVSKALSKDLIVKKIEQLHDSIRQDFGIMKPKIAVLSLNPHAGENGLIGSEEKDIISPAVERAKEKGLMAFGPYAADGFFGSESYTKFDAVLAMYHDQGLIPFKTLSFGHGTNFTAGLSIVRTSPDHGTGFDIAGKNEADEASFRQAVYTAMDVYRNRQAYQEMTANPLKKSQLKGEGSVA